MDPNLPPRAPSPREVVDPERGYDDVRDEDHDDE